MITKAQKQMLEAMRDKGFFITDWYAGNNYALRRPSESHPLGETIKNVKWDWIHDLKPFFIETYNTDYKTAIYTIRPDAEITDAWLEAEIQKRTQEIADKKAAEINEKERQIQIASAWFYTGPGPYQVVMSGQWPFGGYISFNDAAIANFNPAHYSTSDNTFADILTRPENVVKFETIKAMVKAANEGAK